MEQFKILQEAVDDVRVLLVTNDMYPEDGDKRIDAGFKKRMGDAVQVRVEHVEDIPREASGKFRYVVSKVARL